MKRNKCELLQELKEVQDELQKYVEHARKNNTSIYTEEINRLRTRETNIQINLNQLNMKMR